MAKSSWHPNAPGCSEKPSPKLRFAGWGLKLFPWHRHKLDGVSPGRLSLRPFPFRSSRLRIAETRNYRQGKAYFLGWNVHHQQSNYVQLRRSYSVRKTLNTLTKTLIF